MPVEPAVLEKIQRRVAENPELENPARLASVIREEAVVISDLDVLEVMRTLRHNSTGAGPLDVLFGREAVTDICVNGPEEVFVDQGKGLEHTDVRFRSVEDIRKLASRLASQCGRRLDDAQPFFDGHITRPDGTTIRIHAVLSPPATGSVCLSLRVLRSRVTSLDQLVAGGALPEEQANLLRQMIACRRSFLVVGGTGSGKTTMLGALLGEVKETERIIALEDTHELSPPHPHVLNLMTRTANTEGIGAISMSDLLKQALRMRPDRIVVGEIRGAEVVDLLAALNTGHEGGAGTVHANSIAEVPARLEALAALGGLDSRALHTQLAAAVDVVIVMRRDPEGRRIVHQIGLLDGNPVEAIVGWDSTTGPTEHYRRLSEVMSG
ncbi:TadA family conjugal transfer-associated ATPase [Corynebacterium breve]|uniref:TadA family conjugal transfer-associated ATPase n=1 Tax=Corynebacterium breve TaxID=3049799 RepID=A0ABY8VH24_9CORY|nr:TadA family conjugal transfer-associated ATPase [Corynebacterium breve]WIM67943.1 TadA family conjugal transfer-associated ATPase [Corynebacterium breve]